MYTIRTDVNRLGRSIIFQKSRDEDGGDKDDEGSHEEKLRKRRMVSMAKCISALVNGAWAYEPYALICRAVIIRTTLKYRNDMG